MKKAVIDQIMVWMLVFVSFITIFFLTIDYYTLLKTKETCDNMSSYGARMIALGKSAEDISPQLNSRKSNTMNNINSSDINCYKFDDNSSYQVIFHINMELNTTTCKEKLINSSSSAFNELNSSDIECNLTITTH